MKHLPAPFPCQQFVYVTVQAVLNYDKIVENTPCQAQRWWKPTGFPGGRTALLVYVSGVLIFSILMSYCTPNYLKVPGCRCSILQIANWETVTCQRSPLPELLPYLILPPASSLFGFFRTSAECLRKITVFKLLHTNKSPGCPLFPNSLCTNVIFIFFKGKSHQPTDSVNWRPIPICNGKNRPNICFLPGQHLAFRHPCALGA